MINQLSGRSLVGSFIFITILMAGSVRAQEYRSLTDTTKLNKEYGQVSLEMSKLNTKLIAEKNKTVEYQSKITSSANAAVSSGQKSSDQAAVATDGNTVDTKQAVKDAKKANRRANDAKEAIKDEQNNNKKINELTAQIEKKQKRLAYLDLQRAAIMGSPQTVPNAVPDTIRQNN